MLCPNCKKVAFPIELRCLKCDAVLPGVPSAFEMPEAKATAPPVTCAKCGTRADDARIACVSCGSTLPRPISLVAGEEEELQDDPRITRYEIMCMDEACDECKKAAKKVVPFARLRELVVPVPTCKNPVCWCSVVGSGGG